MLQATPFIAPVAASLRSLEPGVDAYAIQIADVVPAYAQDVTKDATSLSAAYDNATITYGL